MRRVRSWTGAAKIQQRAYAMLISKSLARRRLRLSQANVRSITQRRGKTAKPFCGVGPFGDFDSPLADPAQCLAKFVPGIAALGEDMLQPWEGV